MRPMIAEDAPTIVDWRNNSETLKMMKNNEKITIESHLRWFERRPPNRLDYMVIEKGTNSILGTLNTTLKNGSRAESGRLFGNREKRQKGFATEATKRWFRFIFDELNVDIIEAETKVENIPNINFNFRIGYKITNIFFDETGTYYRMEISKLNFYKYE